MAKKKQLVITDPRAIRALAHPARQRVIDELYNGKVLTATECADLAGLTPSAMSYHLRALEKWGIIQRAEESSDGRERPWKAPAANLRISSQSDGAGRVASQAIIKTALDTVFEQFTELDADDPWDDISTLNRSRFWLTHDEAEELGKQLTDVLERFEKKRSAKVRRPGSRHISTLIAIVPAAEAGKGD